MKVPVHQSSVRKAVAPRPRLTLAALALAPAFGLLAGCGSRAAQDAAAPTARAATSGEDAAQTTIAAPGTQFSKSAAADKAVVDAEAQSVLTAVETSRLKSNAPTAQPASSTAGGYAAPADAAKSAPAFTNTENAAASTADPASVTGSAFMPTHHGRQVARDVQAYAPGQYKRSERFQTQAAMPSPAPRAVYNPNMYVADTYQGGNGERDRLAKLIGAGVLVDGRRVKLEAFTHNYAQAFSIPHDTALGLSADTVQSKIIRSGAHTYLQIGLQAMKGDLPRRPLLNIALVIDRSGSMGDEHKLEYAKSAAIGLVNSLTPGDTFSLVAFDDTARVLVPAQHVEDKAHVRRLISALQPGGGTNIYEGLTQAYRQAGKNLTHDGVNRVILLSDGQVTAGISDLGKFHHLAASEVDQDVETSAVGVGVEFNEDLMLSLAQVGKGNYHFLKDGADTQQVFARELDELTHVVARDVKLRIQLAPGVGLVRVLGAPTLDARQAAAVKQDERKMDVKVAEELGIAPNRQNAPEEPGIKMLIPAFYRGDSHVMMLEIKVPPQQALEPSCRIADVSVKYKDLVTLTNRVANVGVGVTYTPSRDEMIYSVNRNVKKNLLGFQTGEALSEAARLIAQGQTGEAVQKVDERKTILDVAAQQWQDSDLARDGSLLARYKTVLLQLNTNRNLAQGDMGQYLTRSLTYNGYQMTR